MKLLTYSGLGSAVVYSLFIVAPIICRGLCKPLFYFAILCVLFSFAIIPLGKRKPIAF